MPQKWGASDSEQPLFFCFHISLPPNYYILASVEKSQNISSRSILNHLYVLT